MATFNAVIFSDEGFDETPVVDSDATAKGHATADECEMGVDL